MSVTMERGMTSILSKRTFMFFFFFFFSLGKKKENFVLKNLWYSSVSLRSTSRTNGSR